MTAPLAGKIAWVTGATRGAGKGIALELGAAGATVYVGGRTTMRSPGRGKPGTVDETTREVSEAGGRGILLPCDATDPSQVANAVEVIRTMHGKLDILVNSVWGGNETPINNGPFWEQDDQNHWRDMFEAGVHAYIICTREAIDLMGAAANPLIVNVSFSDQDRYTGHLYYDLAKSAMNRLAYAFDAELAGKGIASVALSPGHIRTERVQAAHDQDPESFERDYGPFAGTESVHYIGRAVAALAADEAVKGKSGKTLMVADLAQQYGFTDIDGRQPEAFKLPSQM